MNYAVYQPSRYLPDLETAQRLGAFEFASISHFLPLSKPNARILEVGCGCGNLLLNLRRSGFSDCRGVDLDKSLVEHATSILSTNVVQDEWRSYLERNEDLFDCIIALDVIEHIPRDQIEATLRITRERLKPMGLLIARAPNPLSPFAGSVYFGDLTHQFMMTPKLLKHLLRQAGFRGTIRIEETRPGRFWRRFIWRFMHKVFVKPAVSLAHYHFCGELPCVITPNQLFSAAAGDNSHTQLGEVPQQVEK